MLNLHIYAREHHILIFTTRNIIVTFGRGGGVGVMTFLNGNSVVNIDN